MEELFRTNSGKGGREWGFVIKVLTNFKENGFLDNFFLFYCKLQVPIAPLDQETKTMKSF